MSFNSEQPWVTPEDYSSVPAVVSWFMGTTSVLCVFTKYTTKLAMKRAFSKDDVAILVAMIFGAGFIASVSIATANGIGVPQRSLSPTQIETVEKSVYAANLTYIATLFFSKGAVLLLLRALTPVPFHRLLIWIATVVLVAWTVSSVLVIAFQCSVPHTWTVFNGNCVNQTAFWIYSNAMNIVTELCLCIIPLVMFKTVKMSLATKVTINIMFILRALIIAPIAAELYFRHRLNNNNQSFDLWPVTLCMTITQALSIIFACAPFLKPFFAALETGMVRLDDTRRLSATTLVSKSGGGKTSRSLLRRHERSSRSRSHNHSDASNETRFTGNPQFDFNFTPNDTEGWTEIGRGSPPNTAATTKNIATQDMATTEHDVYDHPTHNDSSIVATTTVEVRYADDNQSQTQSHSHSQSHSRNHSRPVSRQQQQRQEMGVQGTSLQPQLQQQQSASSVVLPPLRPVSDFLPFWRNSATSSS